MKSINSGWGSTNLSYGSHQVFGLLLGGGLAAPFVFQASDFRRNVFFGIGVGQGLQARDSTIVILQNNSNHRRLMGF